MDVVAIILAAGLGTRLKSKVPKVLNQLAGATFLEIILTTLSKLAIKDIRVIVNSELKIHADFQKLCNQFDFKIYVQEEQLGTAHALKCGLVDKVELPVVVLNGDAPLIEELLIKNSLEFYHNNQPDVLNIAFKTKNPQGYGRLITKDNYLFDIVEEKKLTQEQKEINLCNSGIYLINPTIALSLLEPIINSDNNAEEFYLTDIVKVANSKDLNVCYFEVNKNEVIGINTQKQKAKAEAVMQKRIRSQFMEAGVAMIAPSTVYFAFDTKVAPYVTIHPFVVFGKGVSINEGTEILSFSHIEGASIGKNCKIGPSARVRPGTSIGDGSSIGNFVEVKAAKIAENVKASHLSYIGDATIKENVNIGAGTIFCNYDGYSKHHAEIGKDVFIGSNTALVSPVKIGDGAIIGAGSVITEDVEKNALSISRVPQVNFKQKAELIRKKKSSN